MTNPIHGQPGGFFGLGADPGPRRDPWAKPPLKWHPPVTKMKPLAGLGDMRQDAIRTKLGEITAQYNATQTNATKLLAAFGPLDATALLSLGLAIKALKSRDPSSIARITGAQFAGIIRMGLAAAKGNIVRAEAIVRGGISGNELIAERLLNAAANVLSSVGVIVNTATSAVGTAAGYAQSVGLGNLGVVIADDAVMAIIIAVGVLVAAALLLSVYVYVHQSQAASDEADRACAAGAAAGHPCTSADWSTAHAAAAAAERSLSPIPNLQPLVQEAGSLLFWGGLLAVGGLLAYGAWVAQPAATTVREQLRSRATKLNGLRRSR